MANKYEELLAAAASPVDKPVYKLATLLVEAEEAYHAGGTPLELQTLKVVIYTLRAKLGFDCPPLLNPTENPTKKE
ncbi:hypothetical protein [Helicobacter vulpis]|uniref:hypothetical protein n=1 Tax=Helicobacter vulpis TaxID=2316076 RepID=UPI000EB3E2BE|nr:hypothetical protein [Helicobacter vulpis]